MFKANHVKLQIPEMMICEYTIDTIMTEKAKCEILISQVKDHSKPYVMLVIPTGVISPIQYPLETWDLVKNTIDMVKIDIDEVDIYIDFDRMFPKDKGHFFGWDIKVSKNGEYLSDSARQDLKEDQIPSAVKLVRDNYYKR
ncbi:hypothetical protein RKS58_06905 [Lysinibacillus capsici]|uniref:hypothetical protein n=1 Tax=Lysinibacillus capsici TaxID=2115968 RepID=UPI0028BD6426|nr:hypothetical protein [Lysinibacillus capsici]WNN77566.1 hypothetical protein RKS58_06905 [Lysinibacillus capsici]